MAASFEDLQKMSEQLRFVADELGVKIAVVLYEPHREENCLHVMHNVNPVKLPEFLNEVIRQYRKNRNRPGVQN